MDSVLSFDVGIRNLAYCHLQGDLIKHWGVLDLGVKMNSSTEAITKALVTTLDARRDEFVGAKDIIIEKQPARNPKMRYIEGMLSAYFFIKYPDSSTQSYSPKYKLGKNTFKGLSNYAERKKLGVKRTREFLEKTNDTNQRNAKLFETSKKKDDLADSLLQALSFKNHVLFTEVTTMNRDEQDIDSIFKDTKPRKPTEKQSKTKKYSRSNLKYFIQNDPLCISDTHIRKAFFRLFKKEPEHFITSN